MDDKDKILATTNELRKAVQEVFTPEFNKILIKYSIYKINTKFNIKYDLNRGLRGIMVEDIISELMLSFVRNDGGRNWNKTEFPDFKDQIFSALDSQIFNTIEKEYSKTIQTNSDIEKQNDVLMEDNHYDELLQYSLDFLTKLGASDDEILLFEPYIIHKMKRADIAKEFGITEQEATNIKKKLDRKIPVLREQFKEL
ncbi:MAG: hypothetical protein M0R21_07210 [Lentimicrobiaceae bacterium]|jgi:hypothetical protein|nr:hypothetical protein [Lentimicrobiaceae bacterium]